MKKILLFFLLLAAQITVAQEIVFSIGKADFVPTKIVFEDNQTVSGFIKEINLPKTVAFRGLGYDFKSIESKLHLDETKFKFKKTPDSEVELFSLSQIKSIEIFGTEDTTKYEKLKLKTIKSDLSVSEVKREVMIPIIKEGKINLYGLKVFECSGACQFVFVLAYIKKPDDEFALVPIDYNTISIWNLGDVDDKFYKAFEEVGHDCPDFIAYLKQQKALSEDSAYRKSVREDRRIFTKELKEKLKTITGSAKKATVESDMKAAFFLKMYSKLIDQYAISCK